MKQDTKLTINEQLIDVTRTLDLLIKSNPFDHRNIIYLEIMKARLECENAFYRSQKLNELHSQIDSERLKTQK